MVATMVEAESAWAIAVGDAIRRELEPRPQRWLATATGLDPATVSKIINGQQPASLEQIDLIAQALKVSKRQLLISAGYVEPLDELDLDTLPLWAKLGIRALLAQVERERLGAEGISRNDGDGL